MKGYLLNIPCDDLPNEAEVFRREFEILNGEILGIFSNVVLNSSGQKKWKGQRDPGSHVETADIRNTSLHCLDNSTELQKGHKNPELHYWIGIKLILSI